MVLRAHLSGPAALESACRAAHDRSELTRMILELLLIPSAPRPAPGSVTQCQPGQPPCSGRPALPPARSHPSAHPGGWDGVPGSLCAFTLRGPGPHVPPMSPFSPPSPPPCCFPAGAEPSGAPLCTELVIPKGKSRSGLRVFQDFRAHCTRTLGLRWVWHPKKAVKPSVPQFPCLQSEASPFSCRIPDRRPLKSQVALDVAFINTGKCHQRFELN